MKTSKKYLRVLLCAVASIAILVAMGSVALAQDVPTVTLPGTVELMGEFEAPMTYTLVAQDDKTAMYADMEDGYFYLQDLATGKQWHSTPIEDIVDVDNDPTSGLTRSAIRSQLEIKYIERASEMWATREESADSYTECILSEDGDVEVTTIENGIKCVYYFALLEVKIPVTYVLKDGYLEASIPNDGEDKIIDAPEGTDGYAVLSVNLLPSFGAGSWKDTGYLFLPDGSGTLVYYNNNRPYDYRRPVYGEDKQIIPSEQSTITEEIRLPVFGMVEDGASLMGVITEGDAVADITAITGSESCGYNAASSVFNYRKRTSQFNMFNKLQVYQMVENTQGVKAYTVRYYTATGDKADYIGMAETYRNYLIDEKGLTKKDTAPSLHVDLQGFYETPASFLGVIPYTDQVPLTTYEQAQKIVADLQKAGIDKLSLQYTGWSNNGIENAKLPKAATPVSVLGGKNAFADLQSALKKAGVSFAPTVDLLSFTKGGNGVSANAGGIRSVFGKTVKQPKFMLSVYVTKLKSANTMYLTASKMNEVANRYLTSLKEQGIQSVDLSDFASLCYSNYFLKDTKHRTEHMQTTVDVLKAYQAAGVKVTVSEANAYALPYVDVIVDMPTHSSGYNLFDEDVPFYQAVIHGYIPCATASITQTPNPTYTYLTAVEGGVQLRYAGIYEEAGELFDTDYNHLYGSTWSLWKGKAVEQYTKYQPILEKTHDKTIVAHAKVADKVYMTEFDGGIRVYVNYNDERVVVDGVEIAANDFEAMEVSA